MVGLRGLVTSIDWFDAVAELLIFLNILTMRLADGSSAPCFLVSAAVVPFRNRSNLRHDARNAIRLPLARGPHNGCYAKRIVASTPSVSPVPTTSQPVEKSTAKSLDRVVCKFGGSSLADATRLKEVAKLIQLQIDASLRFPVVVLSAMGSGTNELLEAGRRALKDGVVDTSPVRSRAHNTCDTLGINRELVNPLIDQLEELIIGIKFIKELSPRTKDYLMSFGERLSVRILAAHLRQNEGINAEHVDAFEAGFVSNSIYNNAEIKEETFDNVRQFFADHIGDSKLAVVTGFIAKDAEGNVTTLGRGGSDLTACVIGASLDASEVQVWKDVDGILSTDPRIIKNAIPIPKISFDEASEMAFFGAKVLHPHAMQPAMRFNVPVRVKNSYNPSHPGTVILRDRDFEKKNPMTAISLKKNVQVVDIVSTRMLGAAGFLSEVFKAFASHGVSVDMIATSEVSISMSLDNALTNQSVLDSLREELTKYACVSFSNNDKAIVSMVSDSAHSSTVVGRALSALSREGIRVLMISQGASKVNFSVTVDMEHSAQAVKAIHDEFFNES